MISKQLSSIMLSKHGVKLKPRNRDALLAKHQEMADKERKAMQRQYLERSSAFDESEAIEKFYSTGNKKD